MKKICLFIVTVALCLGFSQIVCAQTNLLLNPGFEESFNDWEDLWGHPSVLSDSIFHSGAFSASKFADTVQDMAYWSQLYQDVDFVPGQPVYASIFVRTVFSPEATARAGIMLQFMNDDDDVLSETVKSNQLGGLSDWRQVALTAQSAPIGTTKARLSAFLWAAQGDTLSLQGEAYFDDAYLVKEYRPIPLSDSLLNTGFENGTIDWKELYGYPALLSITYTHSGTYAAVKEVKTVQEQDYWSQLYQDIACRPSRTLTASIYVKTTFNPKAKAKTGLQIEFFDANNRFIKKLTSTKIGGTTNWRKLTIRTTTPRNTAWVRFSTFIYAPRGNIISLGGKAYYDDAYLLK